jgi:peptide/nickel transport system substrate-binding protein
MVSHEAAGTGRRGAGGVARAGRPRETAMTRTKLAALVTGSALALAAGPAAAQTLTIGLAAEPSAIDPHYHNLGPNNQAVRHIFESLTDTDAQQRLIPGLAESWGTEDPLTWEFKLRQGVKFANGKELTAQDVVWSLCRIPNVKDSPSSFTIYTKAVEAIETPDAYTVVVRTATPYPLLPTEFSTWAVIPAPDDAAGMKFAKAGCQHAGEWPKTEDFNSGRLAVGTGPYKLERYTKGEVLRLARNDTHWGEKPAWASVVRRPITSAGPRVAALLAGDVDMIDNPPIQDMERLKADPKVTVVQGLSNRVIYLAMDQSRDATPGVKGAARNPFKDRRVREAVSRAINRDAIAERIMGGFAVPAAQLLPESMFGSDPTLKPVAYDPEGARRLLADAGLAGGFELVLGAPNDRYINDGPIAQAVAQMLTRIGIKTSVDATTSTVFFKKRDTYELSFYMAGWGAATGEMSSPLKSLVATPDRDRGFGTTNRGNYSNPKMDELLTKALATVDDKEREALLRAASRAVIEDFGIIPIHYEVQPWAFKKGLAYEARADQYTLAFLVKPAS